MRQKVPDKKKALSIVEAAKRDMKFTLTLEATEAAGSTIVRNIYECFRMLGDALLVARGIEAKDHVMPINELFKLSVETTRPIMVIGSLRQMRHNINYYGYSPKQAEVADAISIADSCFQAIFDAVFEKIK
ncbi:MAG: hypothetical protein KAI53_02625 [Candidatus Aenigmarchaeota archaeon]|nr:hypothetical protein [Candidatus Aenigmarchaeota archaeon]